MTKHDATAHLLREKLNELVRRTDKVESSMRRARNSDSEERAQEMENDEVLDHLDQAGLDEIEQIRSALARIDAGTYGSCRSCGEEIATGRLDALPYATTCIDCAS